jgi:hypothetical protein
MFQLNPTLERRRGVGETCAQCCKSEFRLAPFFISLSEELSNRKKYFLNLHVKLSYTAKWQPERFTDSREKNPRTMQLFTILRVNLEKLPLKFGHETRAHSDSNQLA